ncbi:MAG: zinc ribbon domain-containing protein [Phyllobacteriaceae bacterium]|nr:zinc ribbon domain-containing protein [Phyllobacteriaceae bacterium]
MSAEVETIVCSECGKNLSPTFRFCVRCGAAAPPRRAAPVAPPPIAPIRPTPFLAVTGTIRPLDAATPPPHDDRDAKPQPPPPPTKPTPSGTSRSSTKVLAVVAGIAGIAVGLTAIFGHFPFAGDVAPQKLTVTVGPDRWVDVDPRATFGVDRDFVVLGDGPLRMRTSSGKPVLSNGAPVSLGNVGADRIELKSIGGPQTVTLMSR